MVWQFYLTNQTSCISDFPNYFANMIGIFPSNSQFYVEFDQFYRKSDSIMLFLFLSNFTGWLDSSPSFCLIWMPNVRFAIYTHIYFYSMHTVMSSICFPLWENNFLLSSSLRNYLFNLDSLFVCYVCVMCVAVNERWAK